MKKITKYFKDLNYWLIMSFLFFSNESLIFGTNSNNKVIAIHYMYIAVLFIILLFKFMKRKNIQSKPFLNLIIMIIIAILSGCIKDEYLFTNNNLFKYFYETVLFCVAFFYSSLITFPIFLKKYLKVMIFLATCSWVPYLLNIFFPNVIKHMPIVTNIGNWRFYNMIIGVAPVNEAYHTIYRNFSIFREPGVFAVYLLLAIIILLFYNKKDKNFLKKVILLVVTMMSTISTAGVICTLLVFGIYFISNKIDTKKIVLFMLMLIGIFYVLTFTTLPNRLFGKITSSNQSSLISRTNSVKANIVIFWDNNILLGTGWGNNIVQFNNVSKELIVQNSYNEKSYHNTNTLLRILSTHGLPFSLIILSGFIHFFKKLTTNRIVKYGALICMSIILCNENLSLNLLFYILIFYGFFSNKDKGELSYENS